MLSGVPVIAEEYLGKRKDGTWFPIGVSLSAIMDDEGRPESIIAVHRDISQRKHAESALQESEEKFKTIFNNANDEIVFLDNRGIILDVNDRVREIFGYEREELIGRNFADINFLLPGGRKQEENLLVLWVNYFGIYPKRISWISSHIISKSM